MYHKIEIIYEDDDLAVCRKIPGIPVQTAKIGKPDMVSLLRNYFIGKGEQNMQVFVIHRLDQPVEGVMVFARNKRAAAGLSRQSKEKSMDKFYLTLAQGEFEQTTGVLEHCLLHDKKANTSCVVQPGTPGAKHARLRYEVVDVYKLKEKESCGLSAAACGREYNYLNEQSGRVSLVRIQLETGRHHQIRVQMAYAGHPLIGDKKYNPNCVSGYLPIALCAVKIAFRHPITGKVMEFAVEPKGDSFRKWERT